MSELGTGPTSTEPTSPAPAREHQRLRGGALGMVDIAAATMANIGPAMSFFFGFAFLATTAGVASPLTIVAAGVAVALLVTGNTAIAGSIVVAEIVIKIAFYYFHERIWLLAPWGRS